MAERDSTSAAQAGAMALVTGASGFIGRWLGQALADRGWRVIGVDRVASTGPWSSFLTADITQPIPLEGLLPVDVVFHLAGKVHALSEVRADELEYHRVNETGTRSLLESCRQVGIRRFVLFSTVKAMTGTGIGHDNHPQHPWDEGAKVQPDTAYGRSKLAAEQLVIHGNFVPEPVVLRLCMVYGPGAKGNIQKMIAAVARNRFPPLPEVGNRRSMVDVRDVVKAALLVGEHRAVGGETFIVSDGMTYSTRQMYELVCQALGKKVPRWTVPLKVLGWLAKAGDLVGRLRGRRFVFDSDGLDKLVGSAWFSSEKIRDRLGFQSDWTLATSLPSMVEDWQVGRSIRQRP